MDFDCIVAGGGSAGCVLASGLSEDPGGAPRRAAAQALRPLTEPASA